jgi:hypothetical protein
MFDIVQNLAKELTVLKGRLTAPVASGSFPSVEAVQSGYYEDEEEDDEDEDEDEEDEDEDDEEDEEDEEDEDDDESQERVKVIDIGTLTQIDPIHENEDYDSEDESPIVELNDDESDKIKVLKVPQQLQDDTVAVPVGNNDDNNINIYKKMSVGELRTTVISKGLCSDASKLNKVELLKMLSKK